MMVALAPFDFQAHDTFFVVGHLHYVLIGGSALSDRRRLLLLLPARQRQEALGAARADRLLADVRRLQRRLPADAPDRAARDAAAGLHLSGGSGLRRAQPHLEHRRVHPGGGLRCRRLGRRPPEGEAAATRSAIPGTPARWNGCRRCPASRGACARSRRSTAAIRSGTSRTSCATSTRAASTCPTPRRGSAKRLVTSVIDAQPVQCLRLPGPTFVTLFAALFTGGVLHLRAPIHWWWLAAASARAGARRASSYWLWTGTAVIPEKEEKDVGLGLTLPLYASGSVVGRLVGDVHHDARRSDRVRLPGLRLLLLLDDSRRLPARSSAGAGRLLAGRSAAALLLGAWALDAARPALEQARLGSRLLCWAAVGRRVWPWPAAARCSPAPG